MAIKLIVGIANPGMTYEKTRHNAGAWFVDTLVKRFGVSSFKANKKLKCDIAEVEIDGTRILAIIPHVYMNQSGVVVSAVCKFFKFNPNEVLIAHDELDLDVGRVKLKEDGGHGGHNGLRDVIKCLQSSSFCRLRLGIGHPGHKDLVHNYVLSKPSSNDRVIIFDAIDRVMAVISCVIKGDLPQAMTKING